jgi:hypothetical protein
MEKSTHFDELIKQFNTSDEKVFDIIWEIGFDPEEVKNNVFALNSALLVNCKLYSDLYKLDPIYFWEYSFNFGSMYVYLNFLKTQQNKLFKIFFRVESLEELSIKLSLIKEGAITLSDENFSNEAVQHIYEVCLEGWLRLFLRRLPKARIAEMLWFKEAKKEFPNYEQTVWTSDVALDLGLHVTHNMLVQFLWPYPYYFKGFTPPVFTNVITHLYQVLATLKRENGPRREDFCCEGGLLLEYSQRELWKGRPVLLVKDSELS